MKNPTETDWWGGRYANRGADVGGRRGVRLDVEVGTKSSETLSVAVWLLRTVSLGLERTLTAPKLRRWEARR